MKYKVIKSFPGYDEGDIKDLLHFDKRIFNPADYPEFFQLIEEKKSVWDLKEGDMYWFLNGFGVVMVNFSDCEHDKLNRDIGNCFLTKEQAEKELEKRKIITRLLRSKEEMGLNKEFKEGGDNYFLYFLDSIFMYSCWSKPYTPNVLGHFSENSLDYIDKNKADLERLFELTK